MKFAIGILMAAFSVSAFAAKSCPLSKAVDAAKDQYTQENFGEQGVDKDAHFAGITKTGKEQFFVTIDGTDGGNGITSYVVYLTPGSCELANKPVAISK